MRLFDAYLTTRVLTFALILVFPATGASLAQDVAPSATELHEFRKALAEPIEIYSPVLLVDEIEETELILLNRSTEPLEFDVAVIGRLGLELPLGRYQVPEHGHRSLSIAEAIRRSEEPAFHHGTLRLSYLGDAQTLQAWTIVRRDTQRTEIVLQTKEDRANRLVSFWDAAGVPELQPSFFFFNAGLRPLQLQLTQDGDTTAQSLEPGATWHWQPEAIRGIVEIEHTGDPGDLVSSGILQAQNHLSALPLLPVAQLKDWQSIEVLRLPTARGKRAAAMLTLANTTLENRSVEIEILDPNSGASIAQKQRLLPGGKVQSLDLRPWISSRLQKTDDGHTDLRVRITADDTGIIASGWSRNSEGTVHDWAFFPRNHAHDTGLYPLPPLAEYESNTHLVNLGNEPSQVAAHVFWANGGSYAFGPVEVPAGSTRSLNWTEIAQLGYRDLANRRLDPQARAGMVRWRVLDGSRELIARTETRPAGSRDYVGFNCYSTCCYESPFGLIQPSYVEFFVGQTPPFQACVGWDTCLGVEGPWPTSPTVITSPFPFSWNGSAVTASGVAEAELFFDSEEPFVSFTCNEGFRPARGRGNASTCKQGLRKVHRPLESWDPGTTCVSQVVSESPSQKCGYCNSCCDQIHGYNICKGVNIHLANAERQTCKGHCATDVCI